MVRGGGHSERLPLPQLRALVWGVCVLGIALCLALALTSTGQAQTSKHTNASPSAPMNPAAASGAFGLDLMAAQPRGNLVLSPDSVATALAMVGTGAAGRTATDIAQTLHLAGPLAFDAVGKLQQAIAAGQASAAEGHPSAPTLKLADGLFLQQGFQVEPAFVSGLQQHFGVAPQVVDFSGDPAGALQAINGWVSDNTEGVVPALFASPLPSETRLTLTNAVYFKGAWRNRFDPANTAPGPFHSAAGSTTAQFMHQTARLSYSSGPGYKAVDLPYRASTLSLLVVLPVKQRVGSLQHRLGAEGLRRIVRGFSPKSVQLSLPRFHLNLHTDLDNALKSLGMGTAFSDSADFSGITTGEPLKIDTVAHAADFKVDEAGTVAAAATGVVVVARSKSLPLEAVRFNANRPFLFFLRDRRTGAVLFAGRLTDAASAGL